MGTVAFPQGDAVRMGVLHLRKMAFVVQRVTQHRGPGGCPFSCLPRAANPSLSSHNFIPLRLPSPRTQVCGCR